MTHTRPVFDHFRRDGVTPKEAFATRDEALDFRYQIEQDDFFVRRIFMSAIDAYECPTCGQWHVGNMKKSRLRNRRRLEAAEPWRPSTVRVIPPEGWKRTR